MSKTIGQLFWEIGGKTDGFDKALIKTKDAMGNVKTQMRVLDAFTSKLGLTSLQAGVLVAGLGAAVAAAGKFAMDSVGEWRALATQVENYSRLTGTTAEDSSRLIEITGDLGISYESLSGAMQAATRKGVDTSIEGVKKLADEYMKLNPGVERSKFLMDNFGRSGADLGKLMEAGSNGIDKWAKAVTGGMIVTDEQIKKNNDLRLSLDELNDKWTSLKLTIGGAVAGPLINAIDKTNKLYTETERWNNIVPSGWWSYLPFGNYIKGLTIGAQKTYDLQTAIINAEQPVENLTIAYTAQAKALAFSGGSLMNAYTKTLEVQMKAVQVTKDLANAEYALQLKTAELGTVMGGAMGKATEDYRKNFFDLGDQLWNLQDAVRTFNETKFRTPEQEGQLNGLWNQWNKVNEAIKDDKKNQSLKDQKKAIEEQIGVLQLIPGKTKEIIDANDENIVKIGEVKTAMEELEKAHDKQTKTILFNILQQQIALNPFLSPDEKANALVAVAKNWGLIDEATVGAWNEVGNFVSSLVSAKSMGEEVQGVIDGWQSKTITLTINTDYSDVYTGPEKLIPRAAGGPVMGGMPYLVGERGPELFIPEANGNIKSNGNTATGERNAGGGQVINNVFNVPTVLVGAMVARQLARQITMRRTR
jgi:hypothetical protein